MRELLYKKIVANRQKMYKRNLAFSKRAKHAAHDGALKWRVSLADDEIFERFSYLECAIQSAVHTAATGTRQKRA